MNSIVERETNKFSISIIIVAFEGNSMKKQNIPWEFTLPIHSSPRCLVHTKLRTTKQSLFLLPPMTVAVINLCSGPLSGTGKDMQGRGLPTALTSACQEWRFLLRTRQWESRGEQGLWKWLAIDTRRNHQNMPNRRPARASVWTSEGETDIWNSSVSPLYTPLFPRYCKDHMSDS